MTDECSGCPGRIPKCVMNRFFSEVWKTLLRWNVEDYLLS